MVDSDSGDSLALLEAEKLPLNANAQMVDTSVASAVGASLKTTVKSAVLYRKPSADDSDDSSVEVDVSLKSRRNQVYPGGCVVGGKKNLQMATVMSQTDICGEDFHHSMVDSPNHFGFVESQKLNGQPQPLKFDSDLAGKFDLPPARTLDDSKVDRASLASSGNLSAADFCRICHCGDPPLISPCFCAGTSRWVHQRCLQMWIKSSQTRSCEVCRYSFIMETKLKPFRKWEKLSMSSVERRKVLCSVSFHLIAITCVVWSLYVLIDRTAEEIRTSQLEWPFWTKLVVVAIGFTGGLVFMYVQCKMYAGLFGRWKAYNKVIQVQNCPQPHQPQSQLISQLANGRHDVALDIN